jgi:hypothetical protein
MKKGASTVVPTRHIAMRGGENRIPTHTEENHGYAIDVTEIICTLQAVF